MAPNDQLLKQQQALHGDHNVAAAAAPTPAPMHIEVQRQQAQQIEQRRQTPAPHFDPNAAHELPRARAPQAPPANIAAPVDNHQGRFKLPPAEATAVTGFNGRQPDREHDQRVHTGTSPTEAPRQPVTGLPPRFPNANGQLDGRPNRQPSGQLDYPNQNQIGRQEYLSGRQENPNGQFGPNGQYREREWERGRHHEGTIPGRFLGFAQIIPFREQGQQWGWQDPDAYSRGWDRRFFEESDPNSEALRPSIQQEADNVSDTLNSGDTQRGAEKLNRDLWAMRGDIYAQNELLSEVSKEVTGEGATLYLGRWDPTRGTWRDIEVVSPDPGDGSEPDPSFKLQTFDY